MSTWEDKAKEQIYMENFNVIYQYVNGKEKNFEKTHCINCKGKEDRNCPGMICILRDILIPPCYMDIIADMLYIKRTHQLNFMECTYDKMQKVWTDI